MVIPPLPRSMLHLIVLAAVLLLVFSSDLFPYSVLTHEQIVDLLWKDEIQSILEKRFPGLSEKDLLKAHAYAYGGAVIQDLGYYPFGSVEFSNLAHYVRSGDFVTELLRQSRDANECAFALGALAHYTSDVSGHPAINQSVALQYPKLRAKFGDFVRYAEAKKSHIQTEFGFDVVQVAKARYTSPKYRDFIGFEVSKDLLERVFPVVYGVPLKDVMPLEDLAIGSYRFAISQLIPLMTKAAIANRKKEIIRENPNFSEQEFLYRLSLADYERDWGKGYRKAGFLARFVSVILRVMPRVGPFRALHFRLPTAETEDLYFKSITTTVDRYRGFFQNESMETLQLLNVDFDTGNATNAAEYSLTDEAHATLLLRLQKRKFDLVTPELRNEIVRFYADLSLPIETKKDRKRWQKVLAALEELKALNLG